MPRDGQQDQQDGAATSGPQRIQRKRSKGWRMPEGTVYVGRPTEWGNPFSASTFAHKSDLWERDRFLGQSTDPDWARREAVERFALHIGPMGSYEYDDDKLDRLRSELAGRDLACWCPLEDAQGNRVPCHADVLLAIANGGAA